MPMVQYSCSFLTASIDPTTVQNLIILLMFIDSFNYSIRWTNKNL